MTFRYAGAIPVLVFVGVTPTIFFEFQLLAAVIEFVGLLIYAYSLLPVIPNGKNITLKLTKVKPLIKFSMSIAFLSFVWVGVTQTDKLVLSRILPLAEYGYFTLAVLISGSITAISGPVSNAIMPRMSFLESNNNYSELINIYRKSTQLVVVLASSTSLTIAFCAESILWVWTNDILLAHQVAPILKWYALGNGIMVISAFPYYLQYAKGDLRLHLIGNALFLFLLIPSIILMSIKYGSVGAGCVWFCINLITFFVWTPLVHRKFAPELNFKWYGYDVLIIYISALIAGYLVDFELTGTDSKVLAIVKILFVGMLVSVTAAVASSAVRIRLLKFIRK